ncbi:MAG: DUF1631 domain-containing protein, partial [Kangiellaceae bacterium]|nr:DUF1631 domain-containing protein [Kangiellaceae bacterium]
PSVKPSDTNADKQLSKLETSVKSELESSESIEEINQKSQSCLPIDLLESSILTESVIDSNTNQWLIMDSEQIKLIYESIKSEYLKQDTELEENTKRLELEQNVAIDQWYMFNESSLSKLIYISADNGEYIFVDQSAQKSHQLTASNLLALLKSNAVVPFITPDLLTPSIKLALKDFKTYLDMRKKQKQTIVEAEHAEKSSIADKVNKDALTKDLKTNSNIKPIVAKNELPPLENNSTPISKVIPKNGMSVISIPTAIELSVGSWLRLKSLKQSTNCKLAARIVSKDSYIFVDRQGIKLIELSGSELNNQLQDGRMTLVSSESDNPILLESVIAKTRVLKSEN